MTCDDFKRNLHAYYLALLAEPARRDLELHAAHCTPCGQLFALCQELPCREFVEFLDDFVEDRLPPERRAVFERHLALCSECTDYVDGYRKAMRVARAALDEDALDSEPAVPLPEELIYAILAARRR